MKNNISKTMQILEKHFNYSERTTLNRMRSENAISDGGKKRNRLTGTGRESRRKPLRLSSKPDAFKILISCLLSLRTKDSNTEKVSEKLFKLADTPQKISKIPTKKLEKLIFSSGHYKKKARTLKHVSNELIKKFNSQVPSTKDELLSIKGVGPKTANIVLAFAFDKTVIPVDTHVHRIPNRLGWIKTKTKYLKF